jgi:hypothetical protein
MVYVVVVVVVVVVRTLQFDERVVDIVIPRSGVYHECITCTKTEFS